MKALFIGGTGVISTAISQLLVQQGWDLTLLNRGSRTGDVPKANSLILDVNDEQAVAKAIAEEHYDVVADFIAFVPDQVKRDIRLFSGKTDQYIFISSASAYQKPLSHPVIRESTPPSNPHWEYSRNKIACEEALMAAYRETGFPVTIVRPSHTFSYRSIPVAIHGDRGAWQVLKRLMEGKPVPVPGDGSSLWAVMNSTDFAPAFVGLMGNVHAIGQAVQITGEELLTWNQIMQSIARAVGGEYKPCYVPTTLLMQCKKYDFEGNLLGDKANTVLFDNSLLHRLVPTFQAKKTFDQSARESAAYFLSHPEMQVEDPEFDAFCDQLAAIMDQAAQAVGQLG
ncbi:MAG: SDR family oxidoreductase [Clostridia bacterium]|nr:SDR family oxidoreductase [Clostridia bacterium]